MFLKIEDWNVWIKPKFSNAWIIDSLPEQSSCQFWDPTSITSVISFSFSLSSSVDWSSVISFPSIVTYHNLPGISVLLFYCSIALSYYLLLHQSDFVQSDRILHMVNRLFGLSMPVSALVLVLLYLFLLSLIRFPIDQCVHYFRVRTEPVFPV